MKLITEYSDNIKGTTNTSKAVIIEGIFMQADIENHNHRIYPKSILESAIEKYIKEQISTNRAVGELNHPEGPKINLDKVSHKITFLEFEGNNVLGKAEILNTPMGNVVKGLIEGGVQLGVSSRGMGSIKEKNGVAFVNDGFHLTTIDIVQDPSAPDAFINGIMEGVEWVKTPDGTYERFMVDTQNKIHKNGIRKDTELQLTAWKEFLKLL